MMEEIGEGGGACLLYGYREEVKQINTLVPGFTAQCTVQKTGDLYGHPLLTIFKFSKLYTAC